MVRNLKPDTSHAPHSSDISFFAYTPVVDGRMVCVVGFPNGANLDDPNSEVAAPMNTPQFAAGGLAATIPAGIITQETIDYDNTRFARDHSDFELRQKGIKIATFSDGWWITRCIAAAARAATNNLTTIAGMPAYYDDIGDFTTVPGSKRIGTFQSNGDPDGFVRVWIDRCNYSAS